VASTGRIVVADRDPALLRVLTTRLEAEGYEVRAFHDVDGYLTNGELPADALVVAVTPGDTTILGLRDRSPVSVLAMMPRDTPVSEALDVMDDGADDYVIKPFSTRELVTRLHAVLRRAGQAGPQMPQYVFDGLTIEPTRREVLVDGVEVSLPAREFDLLVFLASSPKQVLSRTQLMNHVWGTDASVSTATVTEHVRRLRQRIEPDPRRPRWIQTVWSVGYRFTP
jgi:DNA-binding response OmpR family regulator